MYHESVTDFIKEEKDAKLFINIPAQNLFTEWCAANDSITPRFITREEWGQMGIQNILRKNNNEGKDLFLPEDLRVWEMAEIIGIIDHDTFRNDTEKSNRYVNRIQQLADMFEKAGIFLLEYLFIFGENDTSAKRVAEDMAQEFYRYGKLLHNDDSDENDIKQPLSFEDKKMLDEWFLGKLVYRKRLARFMGNTSDDEREKMRKRTLKTYFKTLAKENVKSYEGIPGNIAVGPTRILQDRARTQISNIMRMPETELMAAIFRRGIEKLTRNIKSVEETEKSQQPLCEGIKSDETVEMIKLYDTLQIPKLKVELEEVRATGDIQKISAKELEIAKKIQALLGDFSYIEDGDHPSRILDNQSMNCVGSVILGGGLLNMLGIKYLLANYGTTIPWDHAITILITSDKKAYWQDFTPSVNTNVNYCEISSEIEQKVDFGDLSSFLESSTVVTFNKWTDRNGNKLSLRLFAPEIGLQGVIFYNLGNALRKAKRYEEAVEAYRQAVRLCPKAADFYNTLGHTLDSLNRKEEALEVYKQVVCIEKYSYSYNNMGNVLLALGRFEEAITAYGEAINIAPKDSVPYYGLGNALRDSQRYEEAIIVYQQAIKLNPDFVAVYTNMNNVLSYLGRERMENLQKTQQ